MKIKPLEFPPNPPNFLEPPAPPKPRWIKEGVAVDPRILADSDNGKRKIKGLAPFVMSLWDPEVYVTSKYGTPQTREHKFWSFLNRYSYVRINFSLIPEFLRKKLLNKVSETARY